MRLAVKALAAVVALGVLSSPAATATVLGHAQGAFTGIRHEAAAELATLRGDTTASGPVSTPSPQDAHPARSGAASYAFTVRDAHGRPGRWNPCARIPLLVNLAGAPAGAMRDLSRAVAAVDAASGLRFYLAGTTTASPSSTWGEVRWPGNPHGWAPVLIAFRNPGTATLGDDGTSGVTTPVWVDSGSHEVFVSGQIVFNSKQSAMYRSGFGVGLHRGALFEHELGHLAGLDHVTDPRQVMYPEVGAVAGLGAGDRTGLKALGAGGCLTVPTPGWA